MDDNLFYIESCNIYITVLIDMCLSTANDITLASEFHKLACSVGDLRAAISVAINLSQEYLHKGALHL